MASQDNPKGVSNSDTECVSEFIAHQQEPIQVSRDVEANVVVPEKKVSYRSLPNKGQLAILCIARLADPLAATSIQVLLLHFECVIRFVLNQSNRHICSINSNSSTLLSPTLCFLLKLE